MPTRTLQQKVHEGFPAAVPAGDFIVDLQERCASLGFAAGNELLLAGVCRDELCYPFVSRLEQVWGAAFHIGSLAGLLTIGRTGLAAAGHHAPEDPGQPRRYVIVATAHIGMDAAGSFGYVQREHQASPSRACGALMAFRDELATGRLSLGFDPADPEMSLLRQRILSALPYGEIPDPVDLTDLVAGIIAEDLGDLLEWYAADAMPAGDAQVVSVTGVLIHAPGGDWFSTRSARLWTPQQGARPLSDVTR